MSVRKILRLPGYDYSQNGAYFITICTQNREFLFREPVGQGLCSCRLSAMGRVIEAELAGLEQRYPHMQIEKQEIMPNHIHLILSVNRQEQSPCPTVADAVCALKSITTKRANRQDNRAGRKIWQARYYDHVIRNEQEYRLIWQYIDTNLQRWEQDRFYIE